MKKKIPWYHNTKSWIWIGAVPMVFGAVILFSKVVTTYAELPKKVEENKGKVDKIEDYIKEQQIANSLLQKILTSKENKKIILSPNGKLYWDEDKQKWLRVRGN